MKILYSRYNLLSNLGPQVMPSYKWHRTCIHRYNTSLVHVFESLPVIIDNLKSKLQVSLTELDQNKSDLIFFHFASHTKNKSSINIKYRHNCWKILWPFWFWYQYTVPTPRSRLPAIRFSYHNILRPLCYPIWH